MYSADFEYIKDQCTLCKKCPLYEKRLNTVFGQGNEKADILFVGDAPQGKDDVKGIAFSSAAGDMLRKFFTLFDIDENRDIFITNILKCRPDEGEDYNIHLDTCMEHLRNQVRFIKPKLIVCLGENTARKMISPDFRLSKEHGKFIKKGKLVFLATYHPREITDDEDKRDIFLGDFQSLRQGASRAGII